MPKLCDYATEIVFKGRKREFTTVCRYSVDGMCDYRGRPSCCGLTQEQYSQLPEISEEEAWKRILNMR